MLPLVPTLVIVGAVMIGIMVYVGLSMNDVQELREGASSNTQERLQERLRGEYEGSPTNIQQSVILSEWTDDSNIIAILVKCTDGTTHTISVDMRVRGGERVTIDGTTTGEMMALAQRC